MSSKAVVGQNGSQSNVLVHATLTLCYLYFTTQEGKTNLEDFSYPSQLRAPDRLTPSHVRRVTICVMLPAHFSQIVFPYVNHPSHFFGTYPPKMCI